MATHVELQSPTPERHAWADAARGFGITLVVIGHVLRGLLNAGLAPTTGVWAFVDRFIYAFHMPLFFFLSGAFLTGRAQETFGQLAWRRVVRLGYPYVIWASLQMVIQTMMSRHTNHPAQLSDLWTITYDAPMQFWFLYVLLLHSLWLGALEKLGVPRAASLVLALLLFVLAPHIPIGPWGMLHQARAYLPFTALGMWLGHNRLSNMLRGSGVWFACASGLGFALVAAATYGVAAVDRHVAFVVALVGMGASLTLCAWIARMRGTIASVASTLSLWGRASMPIFLAHTIASAGVRIILQRFLHVHDVALHLVLGTVVGILGPLTLWLVTERLNVPYLFEWPQRHRALPAASA